MLKHLAAIPCVPGLAGCASQTRTPVPALVPAWSTGGFANPESVLPAAGGDLLHVSNVNGEGEARDGNGFISKGRPTAGCRSANGPRTWTLPRASRWPAAACSCPT